MKSSVFIVDDHPIMRKGYTGIINREEDLSVCGEASTAQEAMSRIPEASPHLAIVDLSLEGTSGLELIKHLQANYPDLLILVVSMHDEHLFAERSLQAGARGYLMKREADVVLVKAIRRILNGGFYLSDAVQKHIVHGYLENETDQQNPESVLSDRELEVFEHVAHGRTISEIAEYMDISPKTVSTYRQRIKQKLDIDSPIELTQRATLWRIGRAL